MLYIFLNVQVHSVLIAILVHIRYGEVRKHLLLSFLIHAVGPVSPPKLSLHIGGPTEGLYKFALLIIHLKLWWNHPHALKRLKLKRMVTLTPVGSQQQQQYHHGHTFWKADRRLWIVTMIWVIDPFKRYGNLLIVSIVKNITKRKKKSCVCLLCSEGG